MDRQGVGLLERGAARELFNERLEAGFELGDAEEGLGRESIMRVKKDHRGGSHFWR